MLHITRATKQRVGRFELFQLSRKNFLNLNCACPAEGSFVEVDRRKDNCGQQEKKSDKQECCLHTHVLVQSPRD